MNQERPLNIGLMIGSFAAGGSERAMINFANGLSERGHDVSLISGHPDGPFRSLVFPDVKVHDLGSGMFRGIGKIRSFLRKTKPDILFSSQHHVNSVAVLAGTGTNRDTRIVLRETTTPSVHSQSIANGNLREKALFKLATWLIPRADHHVAVGRACREDMIRFYRLTPDRVTTVYSSFVNDELFELASEPVDHPWFKLGHRIITSMGRIMPVKDFPTLVRAFAEVRKKMDVKLMLIGETERDPDCFAEVSNLVDHLQLSEHVQFIGFQKNPFPYLAQSEVYVLSSRYEGMPGALVQAMALGCKPVATDCPSGPNELLAGGKRGTLVPVGNFQMLADGIVEALNRPHSRELGKEWTEEFTESKSLSSLISLFNSLVSQ